MAADLTFPNLLGVTDYLKREGWKVSKSTLYQHHKDGKLKIREDGLFHLKDVEKYALTFLKRQDGTRPLDELEDLQRRKLEAETQKAAAQAQHWDLKTKIATGQYIEKSLFERELAARALVFRSDLENFIRSQGAAMTAVVSGDSTKVPDLIDFMLEQMEVWLGRYARKAEFKAEVVWEETEEND